MSTPNSALVWINRVRYEGKPMNKTFLLVGTKNLMHIHCVYGEVSKGLYDYFLRFLVNKWNFGAKSREQVSPQFSHKWKLWQELLIIGFTSLCTTIQLDKFALLFMICIWTWQRNGIVPTIASDIVWFLESHSFSASSFGSHGLGERLGWKAPR